MALLRRRFTESPEIDVRSEATTVLGESAVLEGGLRAAGDAVIAGRMDGPLEVAGRLVLLASAAARGGVTAAEARIQGAVEGPVTVGGKLEVGKSARIDGDLTAGVLAIAEGAVVRGNLNSATEPQRFVEKRQEPETF